MHGCRNKWKKKRTKMSRNGKDSRLDLKLNLSPPRSTTHQRPGGSPKSGGSSASSSPNSCVSSESETGAADLGPMVLVGCPRCLMYVMLSEKDPRCPKCKSTVLLDFDQSKKGGHSGHGGRSKSSGKR